MFKANRLLGKCVCVCVKQDSVFYLWESVPFYLHITFNGCFSWLSTQRLSLLKASDVKSAAYFGFNPTTAVIWTFQTGQNRRSLTRLFLVLLSCLSVKRTREQLSRLESPILST